MKKPFIAGNWKMYKTASEAKKYIEEFLPLVKDASSSILLAVPFTAIAETVKAVKNSPILIGAQNMHEAEEGAFTGEISSKMLKEAGAQFVLLGHSERRHLFKETNEQIQRKLRRALESKLQPILCVGETLEEREKNQTFSVIFQQLETALNSWTAEEIEQLIIAYEPVWAIGTGKTATAEIAQEVHSKCREWIEKKWEKKAAQHLAILYGGSVKPDNVKQLMAQPDIDGVLVGGASLDPSTFAKLVKF